MASSFAPIVWSAWSGSHVPLMSMLLAVKTTQFRLIIPQHLRHLLTVV
jgi:hypothetical protein